MEVDDRHQRILIDRLVGFLRRDEFVGLQQVGRRYVSKNSFCRGYGSGSLGAEVRRIAVRSTRGGEALRA